MFKKRNDDEGYSIYEADDYSEYEHENDFQEENSKPNKYQQKDTSNEKVKFSFASKALIICTLYLIFVIIGVFSTSFTDNEFGKKEAQIVTIENREERSDYDKVKKAYLELAYFVQGVEACDKKRDKYLVNSFELSTAYKDSLAVVDKKAIGVNRLEISDKYTSIRDQILLVYKAGGIYLNTISNQLVSNGNSDTEEIISARYDFYREYDQLTVNMKQFAALLKINDHKFYEKSKLFIKYESLEQIEEESKQGQAAYADQAKATSEGAINQDANNAGNSEIQTNESGEGGIIDGQTR